MKRLLRHFVFGITAFAAGAAMADVTFFESENFGGRQFTINQLVANFADSRVNDRAKSAIVDGSAWEICADAEFRGDCRIFVPGRYPNLGGLGGVVSSARPSREPRGELRDGMRGRPGATMADVTFFETENFGGRQFKINQPVANFARSRLNDRAQSAIVDGAAWEICVDAEFRGDCLIFAPGRYPNLGGLAGRVSSARPSHEPRGEPRDRMSGRARVTLFSEPNLTGRAFPVGSEGTSNLDGMFNDRASSLRVESGYWMFCSDANFRGACRTFGPGEYAALPPELNNRISSGRRISNEYPYGQAPNWR